MDTIKECNLIYNPEGSDLRNLQLRMLEILKAVDRICRKYDIPYWLGSGTLLGAVRHKGFIPWDDDLDIEMLRDDFIRLLAILPEELPVSMSLQTDQTDPNYVYLYAKVRDRNSYIKETCVINQNLKDQGAFIDIFPIEASSSYLCKVAAKLFNGFCFNSAMKWGCQAKLYIWSRKVLLKIVFPIFRFCSRLCGAKKLHHTFGVNFLCPRDKEDIFPLSEIKFEGETFFSPNSNNNYLRKLYGDYMKIPEVVDYHRVDGKIKVW